MSKRYVVNNTPKSVDLWRDTSWFAIHTKPRREKFAAANISALGIGILLPLVKVKRLGRATSQEASKALFPGYFFARFCPEISCESVKCSRGVLRVVSSGKFPIPVLDTILEEIRDRIEEDGFIKLRPRSLGPGTRVLIQDGPFDGLMGRVERELDGGRRVAILLETLMHARVLIERRWLVAEAA
jgi:transcriptional antiterminator RfaH